MARQRLAGVRVRFPLLDRRLAELSGRIPSSLKLKGFEKRYIFKEAMKDILPATILYKKKHGFGVPLGYWLISDPTPEVVCCHPGRATNSPTRLFPTGFLSTSSRNSRGFIRPISGKCYGEVLVLELWHRRSERSRATDRSLTDWSCACKMKI